MHSRLYHEPWGSNWLRYLDFHVMIALLLIALGFPPALDYLAPKVAGVPKGAGARICWYVESGQWRADTRTLASCFQLIFDIDPDTETPQHSGGAAKASGEVNG